VLAARISSAHRAALRHGLVLLCDVTQIAPTSGGAGDAVNAGDREQFEEFMTSRWAGRLLVTGCSRAPRVQVIAGNSFGTKKNLCPIVDI
jgi:hypothetical protein